MYDVLQGNGAAASRWASNFGNNFVFGGSLRNEIGKAFLLDSASIPRGERVTATAVRMIGQELENVLGGAFSAIARDLMRPIVKRTVFLMITNGEIDERLADMFTSEGLVDIEIVTGLQADTRT